MAATDPDKTGTTKPRTRSRRKRRFDSAAIFDLDRTLLAGASGPVFSDALRAEGVLGGTKNPIEPALFKIFDLVGENYPTMYLTKQGVRFIKGWDRAAVSRAALAAADELERRVLPYALTEIAAHRAAGRAIVMATTTPEHLVAPLAARLGFDKVIATNYGAMTTDDGLDVFDGTVDGEYVWGRGKSRSVRAWADDEGIDLADSHAYSDSYYDIPLLSMVGHPHAVNPDPRLAAYALVRRWPIRSLSTPQGVPTIAGLEPQQAVLRIARPELLPFVRFRMY
ncbi:MAG: HAD-IB family hydrolase, partial [Actinobacteria bacterium]|nr:HAD-IB family hydrolase [Actinomycetota bacterium]